MKVLTPAQRDAFDANGFVRVANAFPDADKMRDHIWEVLDRLHGITRNDRSTWHIDGYTTGLKRDKNNRAYRAMSSLRLTGAIDDLLGEGAWKHPQGWGGFLVSFPRPRVTWSLPEHNWHWDGDERSQIRLAGVQIFTFFSQVPEHGGGTLIVAGSHRLIDRYVRRRAKKGKLPKRAVIRKAFYRSNKWIAELTDERAAKGDRIARFMRQSECIDDVHLRVVELTGDPGDAVICHPVMLHSRSDNCSEVPRFMRVKGLPAFTR